MKKYCPHKNSRSTISCDEEILKKLKGKGPNPWNWGAISAESEKMDLNIQRAALKAWKFMQEQARHNDGNQDSSDAISLYVKQCRGARVGPANQKTNKPVEQRKDKHVIEKTTEVVCKDQAAKKSTQKARHISCKERDPVYKVVDKAIAQKARQYGWKGTPKAMEPIKQVNPRSYIRLAFK